jgi:phosphatidylglycerophosphate synthase
MNTTAVILLLGESPQGPFVDVAGLPLVERNLMGLRQAGVERVLVLCGRNIRQDVWEHFRGREDSRLPEIEVRDPVDLPAGELPERFVVLDGLRVFHNKLISDAVEQDEAVAYFQDGEPAGIAVGRPGLAVDPTLFGSLGKRELPAGTFAKSAVTPEEIREAKRLVFKSLIKTTDGWFSVHLNRPVSIGISKILVRYPIHPNVVTVFTFIVGVASGVFPMLGSYFGFAVGGVLYQLASILDGVDGEIARVKYLGSRTGQWLDTICDDLTNAIYLAGVTVGVYRSMDSGLLLGLGFAAVALDVITVSILYWLLIVRFRSGTLLGVEWDIKKPGSRKSPLKRFVSSLEPFMKRDCYAFLFMIFSLANVAWLALPASVIGLASTLVVLLIQVAKQSRDASESRVSG